VYIMEFTSPESVLEIASAHPYLVSAVVTYNQTKQRKPHSMEGNEECNYVLRIIGLRMVIVTTLCDNDVVMI
jgi:hypothetical protein